MGSQVGRALYFINYLPSNASSLEGRVALKLVTVVKM